MTELTEEGRVAARVLGAVLACASPDARKVIAMAIESVGCLDAEVVSLRWARLDAEKAYVDGYAAGLAEGYEECRKAFEGRCP